VSISQKFKRAASWGVLIGAWAGAVVQAAEFPDKQVTIVVPYAAGGFTDQVARAIAPVLAEKWGKPVVIDNRPGGGTTIGTALVARAPADGHTLLLSSLGYLTNPLMMARLPYDPQDLKPLMMVSESPSVLYVGKQVPANNLAEFASYMRANDGKVAFASSGVGSSPHICAEMLASAVGAHIIHAPYRGNAPALNALMAGEVAALLDAPSSVSYVQAGRMKVLGVASDKPVRSALPLTPFSQSSAPELKPYSCSSFFGFFMPAKVPAALQQRIYRDLRAVVEVPSVAEGVTRPGGELHLLGPEDFTAYLDAQRPRWAAVIREKHITQE